MLRHMLTTSAFVALLASSGFAQTESSGDSSQQEPAAGAEAPAPPTPSGEGPDAATDPLAPASEGGSMGGGTGGGTIGGETGGTTPGDPTGAGMTGGPTGGDTTGGDMTGGTTGGDTTGAGMTDGATGGDMTGGAMTGDRAPVDVSTVSADQLMGADILSSDGQTIASVDDVLMSDDGQVENVVVQFGGILGFGSKLVLLSPDELEFMQDQGGSLIVETAMTPEELEAMQEYDPEQGETAAPAQSN
jgi:hypothetical protein